MRAVFAHARGDVFPPVDVFFDGEVYWLADGFHRYHGAVALDIRLIDCVVHVGVHPATLRKYTLARCTPFQYSGEIGE